MSTAVKNKGRKKKVGPKKLAQRAKFRKFIAQQAPSGLKMPKKTWLTAGTVQPNLPTTDARVATSQTQELGLTNQLNTVTINKALGVEDVSKLVAGYVAKALERGFAAGSSTKFVPFYAWIFMTNLILNYAQGQVPPVTQLPYWLLCLCHALSPKSVPFGHGKVAYKFTVIGSLPFLPASPNFVIGFLPYGNVFSLGWPEGPVVNGFPSVSTAGSAYTTDLGVSAFQELCQFMQNAQGTAAPQKNSVSRMVPSSVDTPFKNDVSTFGVFSIAEGVGSTGGGGGLYGQLQLEVPILHPILALASSGGDTFLVALPTRNFNWATPIAGDPMTLGAIMSSQLSTRQLSSKRNLRFKPIDFLEFGETMASWVALLVQAYFNDKAQQLTLIEGQKALCPLTLQEMLILLRNVMMGAFKESQAATQGIYPFRPTGAPDNEFVPYVASVNTCALNTLDMQLPMPLIENIRALVMRMLKYPASVQDVLWYMPILGQYFHDTLNSGDYMVTYDGSDAPGTTSVFATGALYEKEELNGKGERVKTILAEAPISLVDGASGINFAYINDPQRLKVLVDMWNLWLTNSGVQSFSVQTGTLGTEKGINALCSISMTRVWIFQGGESGFRRNPMKPLERKLTGERGKAVVSDLRLRAAKYKILVSGPYASRNVIADTSQGQILAAPYEQVLGTWILPIDDDEELLGTQSTNIQRWQFIQEEPYLINRSSGENGISLASLHQTYASKMIKGNLANKDDWTLFFEQEAAKGRGGILSGIVAGIIGNVFPAAKGIVDTVSSILPV